MSSDVTEISKENQNKKKAPRAIADGQIKIGNTHIDCAILDNGLQVITRKSMVKLMGGSNVGGRPSTAYLELIKTTGKKIPIFISANNLVPYVKKTISKWNNPIIFTPKKGGYGHAYPASIIQDVCDLYLDARLDGVILTKAQLPVAKTLDIIYRGLGRVGISGLVLEACGMPSNDKDYLQKILSDYVAEAILPWVRRFDMGFFDLYKKMYELKKEDRIPIHIGHFINTYIYKELAPGVLEKLREINPLIDGKREYPLHQFLTKNTGVLALEKQLIKVRSLMCISKNKKEFNLNYKKIKGVNFG